MIQKKLILLNLNHVLKFKTGQFIVKSGIQRSFSYFINLLNKALKQKQESASNEKAESYSTYITDEFLYRDYSFRMFNSYLVEEIKYI